jgi:hypothetical protein
MVCSREKQAASLGLGNDDNLLSTSGWRISSGQRCRRVRASSMILGTYAVAGDHGSGIH